jgi:hypothetical protein
LEDKNDKLLFQLFRNNFPEIEKGLGAWGGGSTLFSKSGLLIGGWPTKDNFYRIQSKCELSSP